MTATAIQRIVNIVKDLPDETEEIVINFAITLKEKSESSARSDIANSGISFSDKITDENHNERMAKFFATGGKIQIDEQAVRDFRERSMI